MEVIKFELPAMTPEEHKKITDILERDEIYTDIKISEDEWHIIIDTWQESCHNGDHYNETRFEIAAPQWMYYVLKSSRVGHMSMQIEHVNRHMQDCFNALIILNKMLETNKCAGK